MKLLQIFKTLLFEDKYFGGRTYKLKPIIKGNKKILMSTTPHQRIQRSGELNPDNLNNAHIYRAMSRGYWRSGIYDMWLRDVVEKNFDTVFQTVDDMYDENSESNRVMFYAKHEIADDIEFVVEMKRVNDDVVPILVITSAVSELKRKFLYNKRGTPIVTLVESKKKSHYPIIYLVN